MPSDEFLKELRTQFDRFIQHKERLDAKTNNMIVMDGAIFALFMGFGIFLLNGVQSKYPPLIHSGFALLIIGIILFAISIIYSLEAYKLRNYYCPIGYEAFYDPEGNEPKTDVIEQFNTATKDELNNHFIHEYLEGIKQNQKNVIDMAKNLDCAMLSFLGLVILIPIFSVVIIVIKLLPAS